MASAISSSKKHQTITFECGEYEKIIIFDKLQSFYEQNELFDADLVAGSDCVVIQAHRVVLCAFSEYFWEIFRSGKSALKTNLVEFKEIEFSTLKLIINFMYSGTIELSPEIIDVILRTASFLKIKILIEKCYEFIEVIIDSSNTLNFLRLANELSLPKLKTNATEYIYTHLEEISKEKELLMLSENELTDLLFTNNPRVREDIEDSVFLCMTSWLNYDKANRKYLESQLLSLVRFQALTPKFIVENRKSVSKTTQNYELISTWLQWHFSPKTQPSNFDAKSEKLAVIKTIYPNKLNIETFNPEENSWSNEIQINIPTNRRASSIIQIDNKLIVVGVPSYGENLAARIEYLDLRTFKWYELPPLKTVRYGCQLADLKGYLCVFGRDANTNSICTEIYDFSSSEWHDVQPIARPSRYQSQITAHNGILYMIDFRNGFLQTYDVRSNKWTSKIVEKETRSSFGFLAVEGSLYVIGGHICGEYLGWNTIKTVKKYDLSNDSWCELTSLPHKRYSYNIKANILENKILICDLENVEEYNIDTDTWNTLSRLSKDWMSSDDSIISVLSVKTLQLLKVLQRSQKRKLICGNEIASKKLKT